MQEAYRTQKEKKDEMVVIILEQIRPLDGTKERVVIFFHYKAQLVCGAHTNSIRHAFYVVYVTSLIFVDHKIEMGSKNDLDRSGEF